MLADLSVRLKAVLLVGVTAKPDPVVFVMVPLRLNALPVPARLPSPALVIVTVPVACWVGNAYSVVGDAVVVCCGATQLVMRVMFVVSDALEKAVLLPPPPSIWKVAVADAPRVTVAEELKV